MEWIKIFVFSLDPTSILVGAISSALAGLWLDSYFKQPKLQRNGSGSGGATREFKLNHLTFTNKVGWFGVSLKESRILGLRIHPGIKKGLTFDRHPARDCKAHLFLKSTGESIGQLWWNAESDQVDNKATIESGKAASLIVFCRRSDDEHYFVYQPMSREDKTPRVPNQSAQFVGEQEFILRVDYSHGRKYEEIISIERRHNGLLYFNTKNGMTSF